jgi:ABC-type lipoprotein export system ATPase subunit/predicted  nucleic acid-binding Zn-ribbon protein
MNDNTNRPHHLIKRLRITGGFLDGLDIEFLDGLNCIIGPRGAGKTTVIELTRFAIDAMPGRQGDPLRKRVENIIEANLGGGRVEVTVETKDGATYVISRSAGEQPVAQDAQGKLINGVKVLGGYLFRSDILSQNQMESIAETAHYKLDLLDKFSNGEIGAIEWDISILQESINDASTAILPLMSKIQNLEEEIKELPVLEEKLKGMRVAQGPNADAINIAITHRSLRDREMRAVDAIKVIIQDTGKTAKSLSGRMQSELNMLFNDELLHGPNQQCIEPMIQYLNQISATLEEQIRSILDNLGKGWERITTDKGVLENLHAEQEALYRQLMEKHKEVQIRSNERSGFEKRRNELLFKKRELLDLKKTVDEMRTKRDSQLAELSELFDTRFNIRLGIAEELNSALGPEIRVTIEQFGDRSSYRAHLEELLKNTSTRRIQVAKKVSDSVPPQRLVELIQSGDREKLSKACGLNENQSEEIFPALARIDVLFALQTVALEDAPYVALKERGEYRESGSLSTGQKCTAILPIILFDSINPLVVDQPEDNLDNSYVYRTVVRSIRRATKGRQMIFATHNPNIPVLGEAARVFVMDSSRTKGAVVRIGDVDTCKDDIVTLLEGGEEAFKLRKERYKY